MENSKIQWTDCTFNPWMGCTKVSPGCSNCYAETDNKRYGRAEWGKGKPRIRTSDAYWRKPLRWNAEAAERGVRTKVFCASWADWLDIEVPTQWQVNLLSLIARTPHLNWLLLTKRISLWANLMTKAADYTWNKEDVLGAELAERWYGGQAPPNVWLGVSVEDQQRADERIPMLLQTPARVRFLSCEPLLGPVALPAGAIWCRHHNCYEPSMCMDTSQPCFRRQAEATDMIDWVIVGGESGRDARPCNVRYVRSIVQQCQAAGVACFVKQLGANVLGGQGDGEWRGAGAASGVRRIKFRDPKGGDPDEWPEDLRVREFPEMQTARGT